MSREAPEYRDASDRFKPGDEVTWLEIPNGTQYAIRATVVTVGKMVKIEVYRPSPTIPGEKRVHPDSLRPGIPAKEIRWDTHYQKIDAIEIPDNIEVGGYAFIDWPDGQDWGYYDTWRGDKHYEVRLPESVHPAYVMRKS